MPAIEKISTSEHYVSLRSNSTQKGEKNDCAVVAMAVVTGLPYETCFDLLRMCGRVNGAGTATPIITQALQMAGFTVETLGFKAIQDIIKTYPGVHGRVLKNVTTHHPRRFPYHWKDFPPALFYQARHVSGFRDGELHDWAVNQAKRVYRIDIIKKAGE